MVFVSRFLFLSKKTQKAKLAMQSQIASLLDKQQKALEHVERYEAAVPGTTVWDTIRAEFGSTDATASEIKRLVSTLA